MAGIVTWEVSKVEEGRFVYAVEEGFGKWQMGGEREGGGYIVGSGESMG
jgi:hypothetical protein